MKKRPKRANTKRVLYEDEQAKTNAQKKIKLKADPEEIARRKEAEKAAKLLKLNAIKNLGEVKGTTVPGKKDKAIDYFKPIENMPSFINYSKVDLEECESDFPMDCWTAEKAASGLEWFAVYMGYVEVVVKNMSVVQFSKLIASNEVLPKVSNKHISLSYRLTYSISFIFVCIRSISMLMASFTLV